MSDLDVKALRAAAAKWREDSVSSNSSSDVAGCSGGTPNEEPRAPTEETLDTSALLQLAAAEQESATPESTLTISAVSKSVGAEFAAAAAKMAAHVAWEASYCASYELDKVLSVVALWAVVVAGMVSKQASKYAQQVAWRASAATAIGAAWKVNAFNDCHHRHYILLLLAGCSICMACRTQSSSSTSDGIGCCTEPEDIGKRCCNRLSSCRSGKS